MAIQLTKGGGMTIGSKFQQLANRGRVSRGCFCHIEEWFL
jgi:hypothetical protein